jgi:hypothetical protein
MLQKIKPNFKVYQFEKFSSDILPNFFLLTTEDTKKEYFVILDFRFCNNLSI